MTDITDPIIIERDTYRVVVSIDVEAEPDGLASGYRKAGKVAEVVREAVP